MLCLHLGEHYSRGWNIKEIHYLYQLISRELRALKNNEIGKKVLLDYARITEETHVNNFITFLLFSKVKLNINIFY